MIFDATQDFTLPYPGSEQDALAFLRDPARSLREVSFLRGLRVGGNVVRAEMTVNVPMLGELSLPFESDLSETPRGALLTPRPLAGRAWVEVRGEGEVREGALHYRFTFRAHVHLPTAEKWGGAAFEKMANATAHKTLEKVVREFPEGVRAAMP